MYINELEFSNRLGYHWGGAFNSLVTSLVENIIMPILSLVTGKIDFSNLFIALDGNTYKTLAQAQKAGASTINYGLFVTGLLNFIIMDFVIFMIVKAMNKLREKTEKPVEEKTKKKYILIVKAKFLFKQLVAHTVQVN